MSRPKKVGPTTATAVRIPITLHNRLSDEAARRDVSVNYLVVRAIEDKLAEWEGVDLP